MTQRLLESGGGVLRLNLHDPLLGQTKEVPLRFIEYGGQPNVLYSAATPPRWVKQATESPFVQWSIGDRSFIGTARSVSSSAVRSEILPFYAVRFGRQQISQWFGSDVGCLIFTESLDGFPYHRAVEALFDESAPTYDRSVSSNRFDMHLRKVALERLRKIFRPGQRVLELGCGTGLETIPLAESGVAVVALDISSGMLEELRRKARAASVHDRIETHRLAIADLAQNVRALGPGSFDGAFSHFGALNCEPHLDGLPSALQQLVTADGRVSLGVWNRTCLSEMIGFGIALRPGRALARFQSSVPVGSSRFGVPVFPYSPGEIKRLFSPFFSVEKAVGVSVAMPPYDMGRRLAPHPELVSLLEAGDRLFQGLPFWRYLGDHFLVELRRH